MVSCFLKPILQRHQNKHDQMKNLVLLPTSIKLLIFRWFLNNTLSEKSGGLQIQIKLLHESFFENFLYSKLDKCYHVNDKRARKTHHQKARQRVLAFAIQSCIIMLINGVKEISSFYEAKRPMPKPVAFVRIALLFAAVKMRLSHYDP